MKRAFSVSMAAFLVVSLLGAGTVIAAPAHNTAFGTGALPDGSGDDNSAFGFDALNSNTLGFLNTATGSKALVHNTVGTQNTATGAESLLHNTDGSANTATGTGSLSSNTTGDDNTAVGEAALLVNTTGNDNTATGRNALEGNTMGSDNTASGAFALFSNTGGFANTAAGVAALEQNTTGSFNTAAGLQALVSNTTGSLNTATGFRALLLNTTGGLDTAAGANALWMNTTGAQNTAVGTNAMLNNTTGSNNVGLGYLAASNLTTGSNNIDIGNAGVAAETNAIRIGKQGTQTATYIAGISGAVVIGGDVTVAASGQLGVVVSSARFKRDIHDMGARTGGLMRLRPVTFRYNNDPTNTLQYGLVAEEVAKVYPELVVYGADGKVMTVRYSMLSAMLLNELQKQARENERLAARVGKLSAQIAQERISTDRKIAELEGGHDPKLRAMLTTFARRLSALERATGTGAPMPVKF